MEEFPQIILSLGGFANHLTALVIEEEEKEDEDACMQSIIRLRS